MPASDTRHRLPLAIALTLSLTAAAAAQEPSEPGGERPGGARPDAGAPFGPDGPDGRGGPGGPGGRGGPVGGDREILAQFDGDGDGVLDASERQAARKWLQDNPQQRGRGFPGGPGGRGFPGGPGGRTGRGFPDAPGGEGPTDATPRRGRAVDPAEVPQFAAADLFDPDALRTWFLTFADDTWADELAAFYRTDVDVPATLVVDGQTYADVGVHFRGNTSYMMARGRKKSLHLDFNFMHKDQRVHGHRAVNLINNNDDPSLLHEALAAWIAGRHAPSLRATLARVVVNGEDLGVYSLVEHFDKDFTEHAYGSKKGARFKVPPDFSGGGALTSHGDDPAAYARNYQLKSGDDDAAMQRLAELCQLLANADDDELQRRLPGYLAIDEALWFLAIDNAVTDGDGYYGRGSDYALYLDTAGRFHPLARDGNEILGGEVRGRPGGPGFPGGPGGPGFQPPGGDFPSEDLDQPRAPRRDGPDRRPRGDRQAGPERQRRPGGRGRGRGPGGMGHPQVDQPALHMLSADDRPLVRRLLGIPQWRQRYLAFLHTLATKTLDWQGELGARVVAWRAALDELVENDVHALFGYQAFQDAHAAPTAERPLATLQGVIETRRRNLLADAALAGPWPGIAQVDDAFVDAPDAPLALRVTVTAATGPSVAPTTAVRLHVAVGKTAPFAVAQLFDDGQHGDGRAGDGVFGGTSGMLPPDRKVRFWVEAVSAAATVACLPTSAGARPFERHTPAREDR